MTARTSGLRALVALTVSTIALLGFAASAHADLYWVNLGEGCCDLGTIGHSTLSGGSANQNFIVPADTQLSHGVAVDAGHVYWSSWSGYVGRANIDGSNAEETWITSSLGSVGTVAVDANHVYWTYISDQFIGRANLDGTGVDEHWLATGSGEVNALTVTSSAVYWTAPSTDPGGGTIGRADIDGSNVNGSFITGLDAPQGISNDGTYLYWADSQTKKLGRATLTGDSVNPSFFNLGGAIATGVAVAGGKLFWAEPQNNAVAAANASDGSNDVYLVGGSYPWGVAAAGPGFSVSPTSRNFGETVVNKTGPQQTFTVTNSGNQALTFAAGAVTLTGTSASQFAKGTDTCSGQSIAAGGTCSVTVTFKPTSTGSKSATLRFASNAASSPNTVALSGRGTTPIFNATPSPASFGTAYVGAPATTQDIVIKNAATGLNAGTLTIAADAVTLTGAHAADFSIVTNGCADAALTSAQTCTVTVGFAPAATGARSASLRVETNLTTSPSTVALSGTGALAFSVSPTALTFGSQSVGTSSPSQLVTVTNASGADRKVNNVSLTGTDGADFVRFGSGCIGKTLTSGATCQVSVAFRPATGGAKAAQLQVLSGGLTQDVDLAGMGLAGPALSVSPAAQDFGDQVVGTQSATQPFVVTNTSGAAVTIDHADLTGSDAADFQRYAGGCINTTLGAGESCTISALFRPQSTGAKTAQLKITTSSSPAVTVDLSGTGLSATVLVFDPTSWDFGTQTVGKPSATKAFTVTNGSSGPLTISSAALVGPDAASFVRYAGGCLNVTLAPGDSCTVSALLRPQSEGAKSAQLKLTVSGKPPQVIDLTGTGTPPL